MVQLGGGKCVQLSALECCSGSQETPFSLRAESALRLPGCCGIELDQAVSADPSRAAELSLQTKLSAWPLPRARARAVNSNAVPAMLLPCSRLQFRPLELLPLGLAAAAKPRPCVKRGKSRDAGSVRGRSWERGWRYSYVFKEKR